MPYKNPEQQKKYFREYGKKWRLAHLAQYRKRMVEWRKKNPEKVNQYSRKHYWANREKEIMRVMKGNAKYHRQRKIEALGKYGGSPPKCACCGCPILLFLTIDHMNNDGAKHRKEIKRYGSIYLWLKKMNYPKGFQVLCMNCNWAKGKFGFCPHEDDRTFLYANETSQ